MDDQAAARFADVWLAAWNSHDLDPVLELLADEVRLHSPSAALVVPASHGVIRGRDAVTEYWQTALRLVPELHFAEVEVSVGPQLVALRYRDQRERRIIECFVFAGTQIVEVLVAHQPR